MTDIAAENRLFIGTESDIVSARRIVRDAATRLGFGLTDVTRIVTAASELARNVFLYAKTGDMTCRSLGSGETVGIELVFEDGGPGIADVALALSDGYSTSGGLGLGLPGARRLMDEMSIEPAAGKGTRVTVRKWRDR